MNDRQLEFRVLGPLEVAGKDGPLTLPQGNVRVALGVLLVHVNEVVATDRLIEDVWGDRPPATAMKSIHVYVSQLRRILGAEAIATRPPGYQLRLEPEQLDLHRFERLCEEAAGADAATASAKLREALELWRGPPFADFTYDAFAQTAIAQLAELRLGALEQRIEADLELGRHAELVAGLATLAQEHPLRERIRGAQMLALYRSGRQADALAAYQGARRALVDELGIEPGRALHELERAILNQDPGLDYTPARAVDDGPHATAAPAVAGSAPEAHAGARAPASGALLGRDRELGELRASLDAALSGHGRLVLVSGEPGIGKSRLIDELAAHAGGRGVRVLWGRCWEAGGAPAYWPWCQSLRAYVRTCDPDVLAAELGNGASDVAEPVPDIRELLPGLPPPSRSRDPGTARFRLLDATAAFLRRAAAREPLVLVLDDLHAADTPSLILLQFLAREMAESRILVVGGYRDTELIRGGPLTLTLAELHRESVVRNVPLAGLARADVADFIRLTAGLEAPAGLVTAIDAQTEGNPLFLGEVVRLLAQEGRLTATGDSAALKLGIPHGVREAIGRRLRHLSEECNELLVLASILGREFRLDALQRVSERSRDEVLELLDQAIAAGLIAEVPGAPGRLRFSHALVRDTLHEDMSPSRRVGLHRRAGEALEQLYADDREPHLAELAYHFFEALPAGDPERAIEYARLAGSLAARLLAYEEAARLYRMAIAALDVTVAASDETRCELMLELGDAEARAGEMPRAMEAFVQAAEIARRRQLPDALARAAIGYGGRIVWARASHDPRLIALLRDALAALPEHDSALRVRLLARLSGALRDELSRAPRAALSAEAVEMARRLGDPAALAHALEGRYAAILGPDTTEERLGIATEALQLGIAVDDRERMLQIHHYRLIALLDLGQLESVDAELTAMMLLAEELRQPAQRWYVAASRADLALFAGQFEAAEGLMLQALEFGRHSMSRDATVSFRLQSFILRREQGRLAEMEDAIRQSIQDYPARQIFRCALILLLCELGREPAAHAALDQLAANAFADISFDNDWLLCMSLLADAIEHLADAARAATLYDLVLPYAALNGSNSDEISVGTMQRSLGNAAHAMARWDESEAHFEAALEANARMGAIPWVARTQRDYARMLRARAGPGDDERAEQLTSRPAL